MWCVCCARLCACSAVRALQRACEEMRDERREWRRLWAELSPLLHPRMQCDFCFMACGCIKPQSNNLVSSGAETTDISHGATVLYCICEPRQHAAVHCHFTSSLRSFIHSLFQQLSATSSCDKFACVVLASIILTVRAGYWTSVLFWYKMWP